ncbi:tetratricopeptide repeat protein [Roseivirga sp. UBA838]|uniref:tetratricopeptide repeat protein n=1 Tax=Roseivirga sp. UBA838 TaxID=1947393 RepID=UPI002579468C|nr:tetratricopeptide repeat protein [Roseivirga sp. UBA838]
MGNRTISVRLIAVFLLVSSTLQGQSIEWFNYYANQLTETNPDSAFILLDKAFALAKAENDIYSMAISKKIAAHIYSTQRKNASAYVHNIEALSLFAEADTADYWNQYSAHRNLGLLLNRMNAFKDAVTHMDSARIYFQKYLEEFPERAAENNDFEQLDKIDLFQARYLRKAGQTKESHLILSKLLDKTIEKNWAVYSDAHHELGMTYLEFNQYNEAKAHFERIIDLPNLPEKKYATAHHNIGVCYMKLGKYTTALENYQKAIAMNTELKRNRYLFDDLLAMGECQYLMKQPKLALASFESALSYFNDIEQDEQLFAIYRWMEKAGDELDHPNYRAWGDTYDSLMQAYTKAQTEIMNEEKLRLFEADVERQKMLVRKKQERKGRLVALIPFAAVLLCGGIYLLYRRRNRPVIMKYDEARVMAVQAIEQFSAGHRSTLKFYIDSRPDFKHSYTTLRKALSETDNFESPNVVQAVINDLQDKRVRVVK